jgi:hypothetical protein
MAAVELVSAVAGHHHDGRVGQGAGQEAEQVARRLVSPVYVLHDHHERAVFAGALPEHGDGLEQLQP